ncbi:DNA polymerase III subunit delta [Ferrigenium kumadai]|uniref:DNA polymerase III subunit delta n=1 Tax=Ferrigenium kumadai TaxID=1682490 RepID=A0AAN1T0P6_9PROT|nr:DNA polymerase III subunit delta [Ferrigenium kumadai]BBJ00586.1 DNA polymerase III subunit delta [Ferrigenium kumadai]
MQIASDDLPRHLASGLKPLYVVYGDALLLAIEAADGIRAAARAAGYAERDTFTVEQHFKWAELRNSAQSLSLFAERKVIDLRIPSGKPGVEGGQALQEYVANLSPDILTLITLPKLDNTARKSQWFAALERNGVMVTADDVPRGALPRWIAGRLKRQEQTADNATLEFLADRCEGNLLAAFQEIQKLALLFPAGQLSLDDVKDAVMDVARYDIFKLSEAMLTGNAARFARILEGLRAEGTATVLVLWAITEDVRTLGKVLQAVQRGGNLANAMRDARVWGPRQGLIENAARRMKFPHIERAMQQAARLDKTIKGLRQGDVWDELLQLGLRFAK